MNLSPEAIIENYRSDSTRLMDILLDIQNAFGEIDHTAIETVAKKCNISVVDVEQTISFYHFFSTQNRGKYTVYLNNSAVAKMMGRDEIARTFEKEVGCSFGNISVDGTIGLFDTACIGMNDQEPAALINGFVFTNLTKDRVSEIVTGMKDGKPVQELLHIDIDSKDSIEFIRSMVKDNIRKTGNLIFDEYFPGSAIRAAVAKSQREVIDDVKRSNFRGRGGAGFPVGMKWEICYNQNSDVRYIICNADEGEPGTFKDRVILTEKFEMLLDGMVVAGYAVGATRGIIYLRGEYFYLKNYLNNKIDKYRKNGLLGENCAGKPGFSFDVRIQLGAGAYVCGEESALIESMEGKRGEPRIRPPFPVQRGYFDRPSLVNNVETLSGVARVMVNGSEWFRSYGTQYSAGGKLLSISGDCEKPGVYEVRWGISINEIIELCGATDVQAVQVGGPSGTCIGPKEFNRKICYGDLSTGGSIIIIGKNRNLLEIIANFVDFFTDESCGGCVPCRVGNSLLQKKIHRIINGNAVMSDIPKIRAIGDTMKKTSRCGLGQSAANPILTSLNNFPDVYADKINSNVDFISEFDLESAVAESCEYTKRKPLLKE